MSDRLSGWVEAQGWSKRHKSNRFTAFYPWPGGGKRSAGTFNTAKEADKAWREAMRKLESQQTRPVDPRDGGQKFAGYAETRWYASFHVEGDELKAKTITDYKGRYLKWLKPYFGQTPLNTIDEALFWDWLAWVNARAPKISKVPLVQLLNSVLNLAVKQKLITVNPLDDIEGKPAKPRKKEKDLAKRSKRKRTLQPQQFAAIREQLPGPVSTLAVDILIETGARLGELLELRADDRMYTADHKPYLAITRNVVQVGPEYTDDGGTFLVQDRTKGHTDRSLGLSAALDADLTRHLQANRIGPSDLVFPARLLEPEAPTTRPRYIPVDLADMPGDVDTDNPITSPGGKPIKHGTPAGYRSGNCRCTWCTAASTLQAKQNRERRKPTTESPAKQRGRNTTGHASPKLFRDKIWKPAVERAALGRHASPHDTRHSLLSWAATFAKASVHELMTQAGHSDFKATSDYLDEMGINFAIPETVRRLVHDASHPMELVIVPDDHDPWDDFITSSTPEQRRELAVRLLQAS